MQSLLRGHRLHQGEGDRQGEGGHQSDELDGGDRALAPEVEHRKPGEAHSAKYANRDSEVPQELSLANLEGPRKFAQESVITRVNRLK